GSPRRCTPNRSNRLLPFLAHENKPGHAPHEVVDQRPHRSAGDNSPPIRTPHTLFEYLWDGNVPPNESRLSCGAAWKCSQTEFYTTEWKHVTGALGDGRRQLQALVRRRRRGAPSAQVRRWYPQATRAELVA